MAPHKLASYLRTHRKRTGLNQEELAFLLGYTSSTPVSRHEWLAREPDLRTALICQLLFGVAAHELFPGLYDEVERLTKQRVRQLVQQLEREPNPSAATRKKLAALEAVLAGRP